MKLLILAGLTLCVASSAFADTRVRGYTRKDGTYVAPHYRSSPDSSRYNNYSTRGNVNPYTGEAGHVDPDAGRYTAPSPSIYQPADVSSSPETPQ